MGLRQSSPIQDFISPLVLQFMSEESSVTLLTKDIQKLSYEQFEVLLSALNELSGDWLDSEGKRLIFAVRKGSASSVFWKATVQIGCVKVDPITMKVETYRLLNLSELIKIVKTLEIQCKAAGQSQQIANTSTFPDLFLPNHIDSNDDHHPRSDVDRQDSTKECCICFERQHEVILPCMHSFCNSCVEEWNESHDTCPICRERMESTDDAWILSEVPNAEEIAKEIKANLMELTDRDDSCTTS